jgi:hypothetical protein
MLSIEEQAVVNTVAAGYTRDDGVHTHSARSGERGPGRRPPCYVIRAACRTKRQFFLIC